MQFVFIVCQAECYQNILKLINKQRAFTSCKAFFKKIKGDLELVSLPHFLHDFWRKLFLLLFFINWPNFFVWLPLLPEILGNIRRAARNFWGPERFLQIRAQIHNSSERLNYMQTLQHPSFKNNYLFQMQTFLLIYKPEVVM